MDDILLEEWVQEIYKKFTKEKKMIALIIDNCNGYPTIKNAFQSRANISGCNTLSESLLQIFSIEKAGSSYQQGKELSVFRI